MSTFYVSSNNRPQSPPPQTPTSPNIKRDKPLGGQVRAWLSSKSHNRSDSFYCVKYLLFIFLIISLLYLIIIASIDYKGPELVPLSAAATTSSTSETEADTPRLSVKQYYLINALLSLGVVLGAMVAVLRESPTLSTTSAICMMLGKMHELFASYMKRLYLVSGNSIGIITTQSQLGDDKLTLAYIFSPVIAMTFLAGLFVVYTSMIWSSEFEVPPDILQEYRWYLNRLSHDAEERRTRCLSRMVSDAEYKTVHFAEPVAGPSGVNTRSKSVELHDMETDQ